MKSNKNRTDTDLKVRFLGGVGEIGKNMTALEYGNDIIVIDAGLSFPTDDMPGINIVIPDVKYLVENKNKVRGLILTHGHEDHIGGVPYFLKELNVPVFGTKLTLTLVADKLDEHQLFDVSLNAVEEGGVLKLGCFDVEFINVNHSIPGAVALSITTPVGVVFHSGDFKIDFTPINGKTTDLTRMGEIGNNGVLLLLAESTNVEHEGFTVSEKEVGVALNTIFSENIKRRLIICMFASNVQRLQQVINLAVKYKRKVALSGRSMIKVVESASRIGELKIPDGVIIDVEHTKRLKPENVVIICTGTQGEPMSALSRMAYDEYNKVVIGDKDTVILSASVIPGNEKLIYGVINNLYKKGADVIYESLEHIHVSGHACIEELKILHNLIKPKYFIPVHGEYRHLKKHQQLAESLGMNLGATLIAEIGDTVLLDGKKMIMGERFQSGTKLIDGIGANETEDSVLKDRLRISEDGIIMATVCINSKSGEILSTEITAKGITVTQSIISEAKSNIRSALKDADIKSDGDRSLTEETVLRAIRNMIYKKTGKKPLIVPVIMEV